MEEIKNMAQSVDVLEEARHLLLKPAKNTKRKILIALNITFLFVAILHLSIQLITFGKLPDPTRDLIMFPLLIVFNLVSLVYNSSVILQKYNAKNFLDVLTSWLTVGYIMVIAIAIVQLSPNTANAILIDFGLSAIILFICATVFNRNVAVVWFLISSVNLFMAYSNRGIDFEYHLMTKQEITQYHELLEANNEKAVHREGVVKKEFLAPAPIGLYITIWFVYLILAFLPSFFEGSMINEILSKVIPNVINNISIAAEEKGKLEQDNMRMGMELDVARQIQTMILPTQFEVNDELEVHANMITATEVGGDFYEVLPQENNGTYFAIGDVTDHGLESGLVMLMTQAAIRTYIDNINSDLEKALVQINRVLYRNIHNRMGDKRNLTLTLLYHEKNKVKYVGQHESILVHRKETNTIEEIDTLDNGMYVGLLEDGFEDFVAESSFDFNEGDTILLYTDGATEAENPTGDMYGIERLINTLQQNIEQDSEKIINNLTTDIFEFMNSKELLDDISLMVIKKV